MKKTILLLGFLFIVKSINSQTPKAEFDFVVNYYCGYAYVEVVNKSINYDSCFWDDYGYGNYIYIKNPNHPIGNLDADYDLIISLIAKGNGMLDTITKTFNLRQTRASFKYEISDSLQFAPLLINFINKSQQVNGDTLTYKWDFGDGDTSTLINPTHIYNIPNTYYLMLTATTQSGCEFNSMDHIIVKDTAQRNEIDYIVSSCSEYGTPPCGWDKHFIIQNDTLKIYGFIGGNCCTIKTATVNVRNDTIIIRTFEVGPECTCSCGFCFAINVPNINKDSIKVSFNGQIFTATKTLTTLRFNPFDNKIKIYPNPINSIFTIDFSKLHHNTYQIEIFNMLGQIIYKAKAQNSVILKINVDNFKSGLYLIRTYGDKTNIYMNKIIINNAR